MGEIKPITTPQTTFKVDGANYRFLIPQFFHGTVITAEEALDNPALLKELVDVHRKAEGKPEVGDGLLQLVEVEDEDAGNGTETKLAPWQTVVKSIQDAATVDEVNALTANDTRRSVTEAATARIAVINKAAGK